MIQESRLRVVIDELLDERHAKELAERLKDRPTIHQLKSEEYKKIALSWNPFGMSYIKPEKLKDSDVHLDLDKKNEMTRFLHLIVYAYAELDNYIHVDEDFDLNMIGKFDPRRNVYYKESWLQLQEAITRLEQFYGIPATAVKDKIKKDVPTPRFEYVKGWNGYATRLWGHWAYLNAVIRQLPLRSVDEMKALNAMDDAIVELCNDVVFEYDISAAMQGAGKFPPTSLDLLGHFEDKYGKLADIKPE